MINAADAAALTDAVQNGGAPVKPAITRTGNELVDEMNLAVSFAAMKGLESAYLNVSKYPDVTVDSAITVFDGLGFFINTSRLREYKQLVLEW